MLVIQAPLVTHHCRLYWRFGFSWKYTPKSLAALLSMFKYMLSFPLPDLLYHFVVSMQTIACASFVCYLPSYCIAALLQHNLCHSLCSKHDFLALTSCLLIKLFILCWKYSWLSVGHYLVKVQHCKLCVKSRLRFRYNHLSPVSVNKMNCFLWLFLIAATTLPASHHAWLPKNLGRGSSLTYSLAQLNENLVVESLEQVNDSVFCYVAHVDEVDLLKYSFPAYIHCKIPLKTLLPMLCVTHSRKIATLHRLSPSSHCT